MPDPSIDCTPLPLNFPQDFLPDRSLLARLIAFAANHGSGTKIEIGAATGIPTGESTGKVEPMIHFARGMGLIDVENVKGRWRLRLSLLGEVVHSEDPYLDESVTIWLMHLLLCRRSGLSLPAAGIADAWFALFAEGTVRLGNPFERAAYLGFLTERHGVKSYLRALSGLVPRSYLEQSCFGPINALASDKAECFRRIAAPDERTLFPAYSACLFLNWDAIYPQQDQVLLDELHDESRLLAVLGWNRAMADRWLAWMVNRGFLQLDRLTGSTLALRLCETTYVVRGLYDELV